MTTEAYELLKPLATLDEVTVSSPGSMDGDLGHVPQWCELLLEIRRIDDGTLTPAWPLNARMPIRRHDGELIIEALSEVLHPDKANATEEIWEELDAVVARIQARVERGKDPRQKDVGQALGLATSLAYLLDKALDDVREMAMERYENDCA